MGNRGVPVPGTLVPGESCVSTPRRRNLPERPLVRWLQGQARKKRFLLVCKQDVAEQLRRGGSVAAEPLGGAPCLDGCCAGCPAGGPGAVSADGEYSHALPLFSLVWRKERA